MNRDGPDNKFAEVLFPLKLTLNTHNTYPLRIRIYIRIYTHMYTSLFTLKCRCARSNYILSKTIRWNVIMFSFFRRRLIFSFFLLLLPRSCSLTVVRLRIYIIHTPIWLNTYIYRRCQILFRFVTHCLRVSWLNLKWHFKNKIFQMYFTLLIMYNRRWSTTSSRGMDCVAF